MSRPGNDVARAYATAAPAWAAAPSRIYQALADALVATAPVALAGRHVADLGAGTGTVSQALTGEGADVVAFDLVAEMLARAPAARDGGRVPGVVADLLALPVAAGAFDAAVAAFVLNHLTEPVAALREMARIVRPGGAVLASTFAAQPRHPAKVAVDEAAAEFGYQEPRWYTTMKAEAEPRTAGAERVRAVALEAGLRVLGVDERAVDIGADTPEVIVAYRLGMAHLAPFVAGLDETRRDALRTAAVEALGSEVESLRPVVVFLDAQAPTRAGS
ncbi:MAG TPA: class I SAM-dependent methyltransferase [Acidimicrobiales bacterium]